MKDSVAVVSLSRPDFTAGMESECASPKERLALLQSGLEFLLVWLVVQGERAICKTFLKFLQERHVVAWPEDLIHRSPNPFHKQGKNRVKFNVKFGSVF